MTEDRILELIRQHRDHQRRRSRALERRGQFIIALIAALGAAMVALTGGNMSEIWGSMLLGVLFLVIIFLLLSALLYAGATIFPPRWQRSVPRRARKSRSKLGSLADQQGLRWSTAEDVSLAAAHDG